MGWMKPETSHQTSYRPVPHLLVGALFLVALLVLPLTQYVLSQSRQPQERSQPAENLVNSLIKEPGPKESQNRTFETVTKEDPVCLLKREQQVKALDEKMRSKKEEFLSGYQETARPYQEAIPILQGSAETMAREAVALNTLIDGEYQNYLSKLALLEEEVASQKEALLSDPCLME